MDHNHFSDPLIFFLTAKMDPEECNPSYGRLQWRVSRIKKIYCNMLVKMYKKVKKGKKNKKTKTKRAQQNRKIKKSCGSIVEFSRNPSISMHANHRTLTQGKFLVA